MHAEPSGDTFQSYPFPSLTNRSAGGTLRISSDISSEEGFASFGSDLSSGP